MSHYFGEWFFKNYFLFWLSLLKFQFPVLPQIFGFRRCSPNLLKCTFVQECSRFFWLRNVLHTHTLGKSRLFSPSSSVQSAAMKKKWQRGWWSCGDSCHSTLVFCLPHFNWFKERKPVKYHYHPVVHKWLTAPQSLVNNESFPSTLFYETYHGVPLL